MTVNQVGTVVVKSKQKRTLMQTVTLLGVELIHLAQNIVDIAKEENSITGRILALSSEPSEIEEQIENYLTYQLNQTVELEKLDNITTNGLVITVDYDETNIYIPLLPEIHQVFTATAHGKQLQQIFTQIPNSHWYLLHQIVDVQQHYSILGEHKLKLALELENHLWDKAVQIYEKYPNMLLNKEIIENFEL